MEGKRLYKSAEDKKICGICGGLGEYFGVDSTIIRLLVIAAALLTGVGAVVLGYLIAALVIPARPQA